MTTNEKRNPPLSAGFDIALETKVKLVEAGFIMQPELRIWLANRITEAVNAARTAGLTLSALQTANVERQAEWCPDQVPDLSFRGNELGGECGEAQNVIKKLERERHGWRGSRATKGDLAQELADVVICASLCAVTAGIDLETATVEKFNATSEKQGLATRLPSP